LKVKFEVGLTF